MFVRLFHHPAGCRLSESHRNLAIDSDEEGKGVSLTNSNSIWMYFCVSRVSPMYVCAPMPRITITIFVSCFYDAREETRETERNVARVLVLIAQTKRRPNEPSSSDESVRHALFFFFFFFSRSREETKRHETEIKIDENVFFFIPFSIVCLVCSYHSRCRRVRHSTARVDQRLRINKSPSRLFKRDAIEMHWTNTRFRYISRFY